MTLTTEQKREMVLTQLQAAGYTPYVRSLQLTAQEEGWRGRMDLRVIDVLRRDNRFTEGFFYGLHADVGENLTEFRSFRGKIGPGSMQIVIDQRTGQFYVDVDKFDPYQDLANACGHLFGEVVPDYAGRVWGWLKRRVGGR